MGNKNKYLNQNYGKRTKKSKLQKLRLLRIKEKSLADQLSYDDSIINTTTSSEVTTSPNKNLQNLEDYMSSSSSTSDNSTIKKERLENERVMRHVFTIETMPPEIQTDVSGNRIVDIAYFTQTLINLQFQHAVKCTGGRLRINNEKRHGLTSELILQCFMCEKIFSIFTEDPKKQPSVVNRGVVWGTLATGSTYQHTTELLSVMDIPSVTFNFFNDEQLKLGDLWKESLYRNMERAGEKEKQLAISSGSVSHDGIPHITVYVDGGWSKRSYGHTFDANSGVGVIIGRSTCKVLFLGVKNKYCSICARAENRNEEVKEHVCFKNWTSSSSSMEAHIIVEGFNASMEMHGLQYRQFIADGDSSVFAKIRRNVSYGDLVTKIECTNHAVKNYGKHLYKIKSDTKNVSLDTRKMLSSTNIQALIKTAQRAIYQNAHGNPDDLKTDLANGPSHVYGDHTKCRQHYCEVVGTNEATWSVNTKNYINGCMESLLRKSTQLIDNETNNRAELFMAIVARFTAGKRLNLIQRGSYQTRSILSALRYNTGPEWHSSPYKDIFNISPGKHLKNYIATERRKLDQSRKQRSESSKPKAKKSLTFDPRPSGSKDYGPRAEQPELSPEDFKDACTRLLNSLTIISAEQFTIHEKTVGQFDNIRVEFLFYKKNRLTASNFGPVVKRRSYTSCHNLVINILKQKPFISPAMEYGKVTESVALSHLKNLIKKDIKPSGIWIDKEFSFLGASPDGLIDDDSLVEVKCHISISTKNTTLEKEAITNKSFCLEINSDNGLLRLKRNHNYYYQIQGQLNICNRPRCYYISYVNEIIPPHIEVIIQNKELWQNEMLPKLKLFYMECMLPAIVRGNVESGEKCKDPPYIIEQQNKRKRKS